MPIPPRILALGATRLISAVALALVPAGTLLPARSGSAQATRSMKVAAAVTTDSQNSKQDSTPVYFESQVDQPVTVVSWGKGRYPPALKAKGVTGSVVIQFIVGTSGHIERGSEKVLRSDQPEFTAAAMELLPTAQLRPALRQGRPVRQLMNQEFDFRPVH